MIFSRDYVGYLARRTVKHLVDAKMIETAKATVLNERVAAAMVDELALEDRINDEVRVILDAFQEDMLQDRRELSGDVQEGEERAGAQVQGGAVRISSDKVNKLAHTVADTLAEIDECDFLEDRNTIRQEARKALEKLLAEETKLDANARLKIASQRKIILEGSQEWEILYRKYYNDEVKKLGL